MSCTKKKYNKSGVVNFGIEGEWGSGKSSFMNMMRIVLEGEKDNIIIKFNPWKSNSSDQIVEDFFQTLSEKLPVVDLSGKVKRYGRLLSKVSGNSLLTTILNFCFSSPSLDKSYRSVENIIRRLNRKVIVFVDDIDRMDGKEVMAVFKLLRNTGDFPNTSYIVAYDQKHITAQIDKYWEFASGSSNSSEDTTAKEQDTRASFFIDKIIQVEYQMPRNKQEKPLEWLLSEVKKIVSSENQEFRGIIENRYRSHFKDQIGTYRIAKRILSRFILEKNMIGEYGNLDQLFLVDIIKVIMPSYFKEKVKRYRNEKDYKEKNIVYQHREKEADSTLEGKMFYACIIDKSSMDLEYKKRLYFFLDKDGLSTIDKYNLKNKSFEELMDIFHKTEKSERDKRLIRRFYSLIKLDIFNDVDYAKVVLKQYIKELFYIKNDLENIDSVSEGVCRGTKADLDKNEHKEFIKWLVSPLNFGIDGIKIGEGIINKDEYLSNTVQEILRENMENYVRSDAAVLEYIRSYKKKHNLLAVSQ